MAHGLNSMIKREIDCNNTSIKSQTPQATISQTGAALNNSGNPSGSVQACGNAKMGSRRIFTPQFKLQVLESYRNDSDCKGNQRATARKYGIHRRQIQKWLQCETNLRSSVANLNQSNIKHQFHNINHQMAGVSSGSHSNSSHNQQQYKASVLSLDTARHSVALTPMTLPAPQTTPAPPAVAVASVARLTTKCVNGSNHPTTTTKPVTNTPALAQPPYRISAPDTALLTYTPAVPSVSLIPHYHRHQQHQHESRLLMPSASLPVPGSPASAATNRIDELRDYQPIAVTGNCYMSEDYKNQPIYESLHYLAGGGSGAAPIDLSMGLRRRELGNNSANRCYVKATAIRSWQEVEANDKNNNRGNYEDQKNLLGNSDSGSHAVDLTCRKRKNAGADEATPEKVQKTCAAEVGADAVGGTDKDGEHQQQQAKPVKLFKPYLLDEDDESKKFSKCDQRDPIIWSHHPTCVTPGGYESQSSSVGSNFPASPNDRYSFPSGSPTFQSAHAAVYDRIATPATPPSPQCAATGTTTYWCPKSSPVSGYDSASTYSDSSDYYRSPNHYVQTYSLDLKMQAIDSYYHDLTCRGDQLAVAGKYNVHTSEIQRWLDQETTIRQGIALFV